MNKITKSIIPQTYVWRKSRFLQPTLNFPITRLRVRAPNTELQITTLNFPITLNFQSYFQITTLIFFYKDFVQVHRLHGITPLALNNGFTNHHKLMTGLLHTEKIVKLIQKQWQ